MRDKEITVNSLNEYLQVIENLDGGKDSYIYRGESDKYDYILASGFRKNYALGEMLNDFKRNVYHRLNQDERNNFLAFAQHHELPTNLIDFTINPIIALYFACEDTKNEYGYVHLLLSLDVIDCSEFINCSEINMHNIYELLFNNSEFIKKLKNNVCKKIYYKLKQNDYDYNYNDIFNNLIEMCINLLNVSYESFIKESNLIYTNKNSLDYKLYIEKFIDKLNYRFPNYRFNEEKVYEDEDVKTELNDIISKYIQLSYFIFKMIKEISSSTSFGINNPRNFEIELKEHNRLYFEKIKKLEYIEIYPLIKYSPILTFNRGINQQGLFIVQLALDEVKRIIKIKQQIKPKYTIKIENKEKILRELDLFEINKKFIYNDFDSIADYVKQKHIKEFK